MTFNEINNQILVNNPIYAFTNSGIRFTHADNREEVVYRQRITSLSPVRW